MNKTIKALSLVLVCFTLSACLTKKDGSNSLVSGSDVKSQKEAIAKKKKTEAATKKALKTWVGKTFEELTSAYGDGSGGSFLPNGDMHKIYTYEKKKTSIFDTIAMGSALFAAATGGPTSSMWEASSDAKMVANKAVQASKLHKSSQSSNVCKLSFVLSHKNYKVTTARIIMNKNNTCSEYVKSAR